MAKVPKSILFVLTVVFMSNVMMNNNCQKYDFIMESPLPRGNRPFHYC